VEIDDAVALIAGGIPERGGVWADFGAGEGTFTRALARILGRDARIYAVDNDRAAIEALTRWNRHDAANVIPVVADFRHTLKLPDLDGAPLDGLLLANALHFVPDADRVLANLAAMLRVGGRAVFVEYDRRARSRWVPYPIRPSRLEQLTAVAGLSPPTLIARTDSMYGGVLYSAVALRADAHSMRS
jgi:SAM-dependent methyltransferase